MAYKKPTLKYYLVALRGFAASFSLMPYRLALFVGFGLAWFAFHVVRFRRQEAEERIREALGDHLGDREVRRIAWISFRNFLFNGVDLLRMSRVNRAWIEKTVDYEEAVEKFRSHLTPGEGAVLAIPHMGTWDLAGVGMQLIGFPMFFITGRQHNPLTDAHFNRLRGVTGIETVPRGDARLAFKVLLNLKKGKILGFMPDLRAKQKAISVRFFGKEANVYGGMAAFARQAGVKITPAITTRVGWTRQRWRTCDPVVSDPSVDRTQDWQRMTQEVMSAFEQAIRAEPEQYFWYNKRWILFPFQEGPAKD